jgi:two-component system, NtrC family, C4-dicarboxylate transport sensor histidine kinase DctB
MKDLEIRQIYDINLLKISDLDVLLHEILKYTRELLNAEAGTIYIKEDEYLKFHIFQNDGLSYEDIYKYFYLVKDYKLPLFIENKYIAVDSYLTKKIIIINDIYNSTEYEFSGTKEFDEKFNYKTRSIITIPLIHPIKNEILGVVQLLNKKIDNEFIPFDKKDKEFLLMFSSFISLSISKAQTDIIKLQLLNEQLEKANKELEKKVEDEILNNHEKSTTIFNQSKISSMAELMGDIAQQWKEPLNIISTLASGLKINIECDNLNKKDSILELAKIVDITQNLSMNIDDFKDFYKVESIVDNFNITDTIYKCLELADISLKRNNIELVIKLDDSINIYGLKNEFTQAILNIINNLIDGLIENISIEEKRYIFIDLFTTNEIIHLKIKNNDKRKNINTHDKQLNDNKNLYMSKLIIEKYNKGNIKFENINFKYDDVNYEGSGYIITLA